MEKKVKLRDIILPCKRINFFIGMIMILGILSGSIFLVMSNEVDKSSVIKQIEQFFLNVSNNSIDNGLALRNSLIINYIFILLIFVLGLSMIGVVANVFLTYLKGFLVGFSISSLFLTYSYKGIVAVLLYTIPSQILNMLVVWILAIYSIMFARNMLKCIFSKKNVNNLAMFKKNFVILMFCIIVSFGSSLLEVYVFPRLLKLVISLYVSS